MKKLMEILNASLKKLKFQLRLSEGTLTRHSMIVFWPDTLLTVKTEDGELVVNNNLIAAQWEPETAKQICEQITNGAGKKPECTGVTRYYRRQIFSHLEIIDTIRKNCPHENSQIEDCGGDAESGPITTSKCLDCGEIGTQFGM